MSPSQPTRPNDPELEKLGERLRNTREYLAMSQQQVADSTGIPRSAVSDIERGVRRVDSLELKKLSRLYSRPVSYFLDEDDDADIGEHTLAGIPRALAGLTDHDKEELIEFAKYLRYRRLYERESLGDDEKRGEGKE